MIRLAAVLAAALLAMPAAAQEVSITMPANAPVRYGAPVVVGVNFGLVALGAKTIDVTVPGVRAGDVILASVAPGANLALGVAMTLPSAPADNTVRLTLMTPVALGVTVGTVNVRIMWIGPT